MEFLVLMLRGRERHPATQPTDELAAQMREWMQEQARAGRIGAVRAFVDGGGLMFVKADSPEELYELIQSNPSSPYMNPAVHVLMDFDQSMNGFSRYYEAGLEPAAR